MHEATSTARPWGVALHSHTARIAIAALAAFGLTGCPDDEETPANPLIGFVVPTDGQTLTNAEDEDPDAPGLQLTVQVSVLRFDADGSITLAIDGDPAGELDAEGASTYLFEGVTLEEGDRTLTTALLDSRGTEVASAEIEVRVTLESGGAPSLAFAIPGSDGVTFTVDDDVDSDPSNGIQINVQVVGTDVPFGTDVTLDVDGLSEEEATVNADDEANFPGVTLTDADADGVLLLTASALIDGVTVEAERTVNLELPVEMCTVTLAPRPASGSCEFTADSTDEDPAEDGFQTTFTVDSSCDRAVLTVNGDDLEPVSLTDGAAEVVVTLEEGDNQISVSVSSTIDESILPAGIEGLVYTVDTSAPVVTLTTPDPTGDLTISTADDLDDETEGVQTRVAGTVANAAGGAEVVVFVDDDEVAAGTTDGEGAFFFEDVTFAATGTYALRVEATDDCANGGASDELTITVVAETMTLTITDPAEGSALIASDDADGATDGLQTTFTVTAEGLASDATIGIECARPGTFVFDTVGSAARGTEESVAIAVTLPEGESQCRATTTVGDETVLSLRVNVVVDTVVPTVELVTPEDGAFTNAATIDLAAFVGAFEPVGTVVYSLNGAEGVELTVVDGGVTASGLALVEGVNVVSVTATDGNGNAASDAATVTRDSTGPTVSFLDPAGATATLAAGDLHGGDDAFGDYLYDVVVATSELPLDDTLCLMANDQAERCETASVGADGWTATFTDTFIQPGANTLVATAADTAGNVGSAEQSLTSESTAPRLEVARLVAVLEDTDVRDFAPVDGSAVAWSERLDVVVVASGVPADGSSVQLVVNGVPGPIGDPDGDGEVRFESVAFAEGENTVQAWVVDASDERSAGFSPVAAFSLDNTRPGIAFRDLDDGDAITTVDFADASPAPGYQVDLVLSFVDIEDGQEATVTVDCGDDAFDGTYTATAASGEATAQLDVPGEDACTLTADVSDLAGNPADPAVIDVIVDVVAPEIEYFFPTDGQVLDFSFDQITENEGMDIDVDVVVTDGAGELSLTGGVDGGTALDLSEPIASEARTTVTFEMVNLADGENVLTASAADALGNIAEATITVTSVSSGVALTFFDLVPNATINLSRDTSAAAGCQVDVRVQANASFPGETARLCLGSAGADAPECGAVGFAPIATTTMGVSSGTFLGAALPEGAQTLRAVLDLGDALVSTPSLPVTVDCTRPTLTAWDLTNDDGGDAGLGADDGILNADESPTGSAEVTVQFAGLGGQRTVQVFRAGSVLVASGTTAVDESFSFAAVLPQGGHTLTATVSDVAGNAVGAGAPTLPLAIDTVAPSLTITNPVEDAVLLVVNDLAPAAAGATVNAAILATGAPAGAEVTLTGMTPAGGPLTVDADGEALGSVVIAEGTDIAIGASVYDSGFNLGSTTSNVAVVDVTPPTISLTAPADSDPGTEGIQLSGLALSLTVETTQAEVCATSGRCTVFVESSVGGVVGSAPIASTSGADLAATTVVPVNLPGGAQNLNARVVDANGNPATSASVAVEAPVLGCGISFLAPEGNPVLIDAEGFVGDPGVDPETIDVRIAVANIADCVGQEPPVQVRLRFGCALDATDGDCAASCDSNRAGAGGCVLTGAVEPAGVVVFDDVPFFDGETVTMHGIVEHLDLPVSTTQQKTVRVDLSPPTISNVSPDGATPLSLQLAADSSSWTTSGTQLVGTVSFQTTGAVGGRYTLRYNGTTLQDSVGPVSNVAISADAISRPGVRFPTVDEAVGAQLEVFVVDAIGNETSELVTLNVDGAPPTAPVLTLTPDADAMRSGASDLSWTASTDDAGGNGGVAMYEVGYARADRVANWNDISVWRDADVVTRLEAFDADTLSAVLEGLPFDAQWDVGVRAFDEVGNWSAVASQGRSTELEEAVIATLTGDLSNVRSLVNLGDVNGDDRDDLLVSNFGTALLMLGSADPTDRSGSVNIVLADDGDFFGDAAGIGDVNGDGLDDFMVGNFFNDDFLGVLHLYFGSTDPTELVLADVDIVSASDNFSGFYTGTFETYSGRGNFADFDGEPEFEDFYIVSADAFGDGFHTVIYVVLGRSNADWFGAGNTPDTSATAVELTLADLFGDAGAAADNCALDIITIDGRTGASTSHAQGLGLTGGLTNVSDGAGTWADLVLSSYRPTSEPVVQYVYLGGSLLGCPTSGWDLSVADAVYENAPVGNTYQPRMAVNPDGGEWAVGLRTDDVVEVLDFDGLYQSITGPDELIAGNPPRSAYQLGNSVAFAGNLDEDPLGLGDLVIGSPPNTAAVPAPTRGYVFLALGEDRGEGQPRFDNRVTQELTIDDGPPSIRFGSRVIADFDFDGDGHLDVAVLDASTGDIYLFYGLADVP